VAAGGAWPEVGSSSRIGVLIGLAQSDPEGRRWADALIKSLQELGWRQGENLQIDLRWGGSDPMEIQALAAELVATKPELIAVSTTPGTAAVLQQTRTIPMVFSAVADAFGTGFITNLARPGGNVTGFINLEESIGGKWVELLKELAPSLARVTLLYNAATAAAQAAYFRGPIENAAASHALTTQLAPWDDVNDIEQTIVALGQRDAGLIVIPTPHTTAQRELIVSLANHHRMAGHLSVSLLGQGRRSHLLRRRPSRFAPSCRWVRRPNPERCQARRPSSAASDQVRAGDQPKDGNST
jgi:putative ABC transport system substrate-binding protein